MIGYDNCRNCVARCEHAGKNREFVHPAGKSCKVVIPEECKQAFVLSAAEMELARYVLERYAGQCPQSWREHAAAGLAKRIEEEQKRNG